MIIEMMLGDCSYDGHEKTQSLFIECNVTEEEITLAYKKGVIEVGLDLEKEVATEYNEPYIYDDQVKILSEAGFVFDDLRENHDNKMRWYVDWDEFFRMYMFLVEKGNPSIEWKRVKFDVVIMGGYGLFN